MNYQRLTNGRLSSGRWLLALICLGFFLRLYVVLNAVTISVDGFGYINIAKGFLEGNYNEGLSVIRRPHYPLLLGLVSLVVDDYELAGRIVSLVFGTLVIPVGFYLGRAVYNERVGLFAAFFVSIHPYMIRYSGDVLTEGVYYFLIATVTLLGLKAVSQRSSGLMLLAGLFAILAYLTRPGAIVIWGVITLWAVFYDFHKIREDWRGRIGPLFVGFTILTSMAVPYLFLIPAETGKLAFTGKLSLGSLEPVVSVLLSFSSGEKVVKFLQDFPEGFTFPFLALFVWGFIKRKREGFIPSEYYLIALMLTSWLFYLGVNPSERYFTHLMPAALVLSAVGFYHVEKLLKTRAREKAALFTAVLILVITAFQLPKGMVSLHAHRLPERLAGEWLENHEGRPCTVMARKPIVAFYAGCYHISLPQGRLGEVIKYGSEEGAEYMAGYTSRLRSEMPDFDTEKGRFLEEVKSFKAQREDEFILYRLGVEG
jgi:4-amino-4-deoxy-L-arabinose transferase-like glycosyltransferase